MKNIFQKEPSSPRTEGFDGGVVQDRDSSIDDAAALFAVDFMADAWVGRGRILIDMTAGAWTPVRGWINGRRPSRRPATGRTLPAIASGSAEA